MHSVRLGHLPGRLLAREDLQHHLRLQLGRVPPPRHVDLLPVCQVLPWAAPRPEVKRHKWGVSRIWGSYPGKHWDGILLWFRSRITNGMIEGINSLVQAAKARARGYRTTENFITIAYLVCGKLNFNLPN